MNTCTLATAADQENSSREIPVGEGRARKERSDCRVTDAGVYDAIVAHFGILSYVAIAVGISRAANRFTERVNFADNERTAENPLVCRLLDS